LLGAPGQRLHRERLAEFLWPDFDVERTSGNLRLTVHRLRKLLTDRVRGDGYVRADGECLVLSPVWSGDAPPDWLDAEVFERLAAGALASRNLDQCRVALAIYQGEYLPGDLYDEWTAGRREALHLRYLALLLHQAELAGAQGEGAEEEEALRAILTCDPCSEDAGSRLMSLLAAAGRGTEALRVFDGLASALRRELGVAPSSDILALRKQLLGRAAGATVPVMPRPVAPPRPTNLPIALSSFVGRERDLDDVRRRLQGARLLTLTGIGGCGKTRLALQVAEQLLEQFPDGVWLVQLCAAVRPGACCSSWITAST